MIESNSILFSIMCVFAIQAMILSGLIALKRPRLLANIFLALLVFFYALIILNIVLVNVLNDYGMLYLFRYIQIEMLYGIGPSLYFYTKTISNTKFQFKKEHYAHFLPLILEFIFYRTAIYRIGSDGLYLEELPTYSYIYLTQQWLGVISIFIYSSMSLGILIKYQKQLKNYYSKLENLSLKWLQTPVIVFASYFIYWNILTELDRSIFDGSLREYYFLPNFVLLGIIINYLGFKGYIQKERELVQLQPIPKKIKETPASIDEDFLSELRNLMKTEKPYLNPELDLSKFAQLFEMKTKELSAKINKNCQQNFYDLINSYRINAFKKRLQSSERDKLSLLGHAFECGFNSKSTFNHVFKKNTQLTPSQYLKNVKNESE